MPSSASERVGEAQSWPACKRILLDLELDATARAVGEESSNVHGVPTSRGGEGAVVSERNSGFAASEDVEVMTHGSVTSREGVVGMSKEVRIGVTTSRVVL